MTNHFKLLLLLMAGFVIGLTSCSDDSGSNNPVLSYLIDADGTTPVNVPQGATFQLRMEYTTTYTQGTMTLVDWDNTLYPMPSGFGNGSFDTGTKKINNATFDTFEASESQVKLVWTDDTSGSRVASTPTVYTYVFKVVQ